MFFFTGQGIQIRFWFIKNIVSLNQNSVSKMVGRQLFDESVWGDTECFFVEYFAAASFESVPASVLDVAEVFGGRFWCYDVLAEQFAVLVYITSLTLRGGHHFPPDPSVCTPHTATCKTGHHHHITRHWRHPTSGVTDTNCAIIGLMKVRWWYL